MERTRRVLIPAGSPIYIVDNEQQQQGHVQQQYREREQRYTHSQPLPSTTTIAPSQAFHSRPQHPREFASSPSTAAITTNGATSNAGPAGSRFVLSTGQVLPMQGLSMANTQLVSPVSPPATAMNRYVPTSESTPVAILRHGFANPWTHS